MSKVYRLAGRWKNKKLPPPFIDLKIASGGGELDVWFFVLAGVPPRD